MVEEEKEERIILRSMRKWEEEEILKREMIYCNLIKLNLSLLWVKKLGDFCEMYKILVCCYNYRKVGYDGYYCWRCGCLKCNGRYYISICKRNDCFVYVKLFLGIIFVKFNRIML